MELSEIDDRLAFVHDGIISTTNIDDMKRLHDEQRSLEAHRLDVISARPVMGGFDCSVRIPGWGIVSVPARVVPREGEK